MTTTAIPLQVHELHKEFIARNKEQWERVQIYDFVH